MTTTLATLLRFLIMPALIGLVVFPSAGRWDLPFVWGVMGVLTAFYLFLTALGDRGLIQERQVPGGANQDRLTRPLGMVLLVGHWVLAGLDVGRFHWSPVPWGIQLAGLLGFAAALCVNFWAMRVNRFNSSVVRVQADRAHRVIEAGPYRFVRHPGYTATLVAMFCGAAALGSWIAMLPILGFAAAFVRRTLLEDRLLQAELPGYSDYAQRVRSRLVPGVF